MGVGDEVGWVGPEKESLWSLGSRSVSIKTWRVRKKGKKDMRTTITLTHYHTHCESLYSTQLTFCVKLTEKILALPSSLPDQVGKYFRYRWSRSGVRQHVHARTRTYTHVQRREIRIFESKRR